MDGGHKYQDGTASACLCNQHSSAAGQGSFTDADMAVILLAMQMHTALLCWGLRVHARLYVSRGSDAYC
jgi:hypothetical protein